MGSTQPVRPPGLTSQLESPAASVPAKREGSTPPLAAKPEREAEVDSTSQPISNKRVRVTNPLLRPRHGLMPQTLPRSATVLYRPSGSASGAARPFTGDALTATSPTVSSSAAPPSSSTLSGGEQLQERSHPGLLLPSPVEHLPSSGLPGPLADLPPQAGPALRLPLTPMSSTLPLPSSTSFESQKRWRGLPCASPIPPSYEGQDGRSILPLMFPTKRQANRWARIYIGGEDPELAERLSLSPSGTGAAKAPAVEAGQSDEEASEGSTTPGADTKRTSAGVWLTRGKNGGRPGDLEVSTMTMTNSSGLRPPQCCAVRPHAELPSLPPLSRLSP
ncbi:hypothetical protein BCV69DRAFT_131132 [Microstroma glucosiphilum]|uniref:Uncharacterized protein n=1 Tax=Pseudomicrostroma glucosiphilum TaxID=1684307 RepID=A0A316TVV0_9BASI|nr:hypothetical protein BCV69DRAFT_131132 [Pseudomicrostroma glucosiphilum]PWN17672.1 hypothetical protein BCV69DRAFT_131132 [Pseudomicrostroma glucosiphilum]